MPHFPFSKLFSIYPPSTTLFSNQKVFFQNQYMDSTIGSKMTLVNIVPQVVLHQKMHLLETDNFLGESNRLPAPSVEQAYKIGHLLHKYEDLC